MSARLRPASMLLLAGALGLGACDAAQAVRVAGGALTVAGPAGYCVDQGLSRPGAAEPFVVLGPCSALAHAAAAGPAAPGILTAAAAAAPAETADPGALERFLRSARGRAAISQVGRAETVAIQSTRREGNALLVQIRDTGTAPDGAATDPVYWRAVFPLKGRLVTATVRAFAGRPLSRDQGFALLRDFVSRLRAANAEGPRPAPT